MKKSVEEKLARLEVEMEATLKKLPAAEVVGDALRCPACKAKGEIGYTENATMYRRVSRIENGMLVVSSDEEFSDGGDWGGHLYCKRCCASLSFPPTLKLEWDL